MHLLSKKKKQPPQMAEHTKFIAKPKITQHINKPATNQASYPIWLQWKETCTKNSQTAPDLQIEKKSLKFPKNIKKYKTHIKWLQKIPEKSP